MVAGCHAEREEVSDSLSTAFVTSTWFWSPTSRVQGILCAWVWKVPTLRGWAWAATGGKIGNPTPFWWARPSPLESPAVTDARQPHGTWHHLIGSSDKPSWERISASKKNRSTLSNWMAPLCIFGLSVSVSHLLTFLYFPGKFRSGWC